MFRWLPPAFEPVDALQDIRIDAVLRELATILVSTDFHHRIDRLSQKTPDSDLTTPEIEDENRNIPAGYTYLGQFIDHDITFDPASSLQRQNDPDTLEDFRTPRLDLDSLYGRGPDEQPYLYKKPAAHLSMRATFRLHESTPNDFVRLVDDGTALIADKRNDENKIVSQIHALFLRFHNKIFDNLGLRFRPEERRAQFAEAQRIVRWCYQWIVLRDYLPKVCGEARVKCLLPGKLRQPKLKFYRSKSGCAYIPIEFSGAAFRFGHAMVRPSYSLNAQVMKSRATFTSAAGTVTEFARVPIFAADPNSTEALNGQQALPAGWGIDWRFFFGEFPPATPGTAQIPQPSYRIRAKLVDPLGELPEFAADKRFASLAARNLLRGLRLGLPSGQAVARTMGFEPLNEEHLWFTRMKGDDVVDWPQGKDFFDKNQKTLEGRAPLWFYILKEAEIVEKGERLGPVGAQIVAETLIGLAWYDHFSYLFQVPNWNPSYEKLPGLGADLDMLKLTEYVG
jgi:hypothetical protein